MPTGPRLAKFEPVRVSSADVVRQFSLYADMALTSPVIVSKHGRDRNVILSFEEYNRLTKRDLISLKSEDTPQEFIDDLESFISERDIGEKK